MESCKLGKIDVVEEEANVLIIEKVIPPRRTSRLPAISVGGRWLVVGYIPMDALATGH